MRASKTTTRVSLRNWPENNRLCLWATCQIWWFFNGRKIVRYLLGLFVSFQIQRSQRIFNNSDNPFRTPFRFFIIKIFLFHLIRVVLLEQADHTVKKICFFPVTNIYVAKVNVLYFYSKKLYVLFLTSCMFFSDFFYKNF